MKRFVKKFKKSTNGLIGALILLILLPIILFPGLMAPYNPLEQNTDNVLAPPSREHLLGTDDLGRDVYSRLIYGARPTVSAGVASILLAMLLGVPFGLMAGYFGGIWDTVVMRICDTILSFPPLVLALGVTAAMGAGLVNVSIAIAVVFAPRFTRVVRGHTLSLREMAFVESARSQGARSLYILYKHILPNALNHIIVQTTFSIGIAMLTEAGLSFLGLSKQLPEPSWGMMLRVGYRYVWEAPFFPVGAGFAIFVAILAVNLFGEGLRTALSPRTYNQ